MFTRRLAVRAASATFTSRMCATTGTSTGASQAAGVPPPESQKMTPAKPIETVEGANDDDVVIDPVPEDLAQGSAGATSAQAEPAMKESTREEMGFKTETRQLLDIVACSLYSDKEVFIRELVSNASDALEKRRHLQLANGEEYPASEEPAGIHLEVNQSKTVFAIRDTGIGMTKEELAANLGTIASSGSKAFVRELQKNPGGSSASAEKIIGQFGVGFYSAFMVAKTVKVFSRSAKKDAQGYCWESDGTGTFTITEVDNLPVGTKIVLDVKDTELGFCTPQVVERVIKKYSNFVEFEISLNGGRLNTVDALWMKSKDEISNEDHVDFYKFVSGAYDAPQFRLHYSVDAPMSIRALLYVPQSHTEKYGGGRMESGVNLYCRRVLIQSKAKGLLPDWLRFLKGAVDSESIPLNISREHTQDSAMMRKLSTILTKRALKWLAQEAKTDRPKFEQFIKEFGGFLKEGVCTDQIHKMEIAKLLRFETSNTDVSSSSLVSLDEYVERMQANQTHIYYLSAPSVEMAKASPYFEQYSEHNLEVLVLTEPIDEFVMNHLESYAKHKLQNIETFDAAHDGFVQDKKKQAESGEKKDGEESKDDVKLKQQLSEDECKELSDFISKRLLGKVGIVKSTTRLRDSPAMLADHESAQMRKLYKITGQQQGPAPKYNFHFNAEHPLVRKVHKLSTSSESESREVAGLLVEQLFDNAIIAAGLLDDPRSMVGRLNALMTRMAKDV